MYSSLLSQLFRKPSGNLVGRFGVQVDKNQVFALTLPLVCQPTLHRHPFIDGIHSKVGREEAKNLHGWKLDEDENQMSSTHLEAEIGG
jgi:hypothetical protein